MADEFEWQTDVDSGWEPPAPEPGQPERQPNKRRTVIVLAIVACLLLAVAFGLYRTLSGRVEEATSTAESGLLLAHELLVSGALTSDQDRVMSVVAQRPASWHDLVADLAARQLIFSRRPLGLEVAREGETQPLAEDDIRLSPELDAAEIVDRRSYLVTGLGLAETVVLEQTFSYQRAGEQWQLSPPADEEAFWGNWVTDRRANITTTYPERDETIALKLSNYLDTFLPALCATDGMACPDDFHLAFKLERDPTSIRRLAEGVYAIRASSAASGDRLVLPAPSLVGRPLDDAGYEALQRGYAGWIGASLVAGYGASTDEVGDVLAQFGLQTPPAPASPLPRPVAAPFLAGEARPSQDVLLLCSQDNSDRLLRFVTASGTWREEAPAELWGLGGALAGGRSPGTSSYMTRLPDYRGVIIHTISGQDEPIFQSYLVLDGRARLLTEERQIHYLLPPRVQPAVQPPGDRLVYFVPAAAEGEGFSAQLVRLDECPASPCTPEPLAGMPVWSPDGQRSVVIAPGSYGSQLLYLGDEDGRIVTEVGVGQSPVWLDSHRFLYIAQGQQDNEDRLARWLGREALLVDSDDTPPLTGTLLFDAEMVRQLIPASMRPDSLALWTVQETMPNSGWLYVTARGERAGESVDYVLVYDPAASETKLALPLEEYALVGPPMVNSTGQQAVAVSLSGDSSQMSVELIDASTGQVRRLASRVPEDWSADGDWLIQLDQGEMTLASTADDSQWLIQYDLTGCYSAVWTQQEGQ